MESETVRITLRIPKDIHAEAVNFAKEEDRSLNWQFVRQLKMGAAQIVQQKKNAQTANLGG